MKTRGFTWRKACGVVRHFAAEVIGELYLYCPRLFDRVCDRHDAQQRMAALARGKARQAFYEHVEAVNARDVAGKDLKVN